jgi:tetratricopeptide (TPR) repeat protein
MSYGRIIFRAMMGALLLCTAGAAFGAAGRFDKAPPLNMLRQPTAMERYLEQADAAIQAAEQSEAATASAAVASLSALIDDALFTMLSKPQQRMLVSAKGLATWRGGDPEGARDLFTRATAIDGNEPDDWYRLAILEHELGDRARSARYMTSLINRWPELVNNLDPRLLGDYVYRGEAGATWRTALMQALFDADWDDRHNGVDDVWRELALAQVENGSLPAAANAIMRITDPLTTVKVRSDKRFDALIAGVDALPSARDVAERRVEVLRRLVAESPKRIDLASTFGTALLVAGRHEEALAAADALLAAIAAEDPSSFEKLDEKVWIMNNRAIALRRLGRQDEAAAQFERASHVDELGSPNVSQVLNLAAYYCDLGRPKEALRTIERVGNASGYGRMVQSGIQHCAALQTGNRQAAREAMNYMTAHRSDSSTMIIEALLREGRIDEAAATLIGQLEDPKGRDEALNFLQDFRKGPELVGTRTLNANRRALLTRADIKAAAERVGHLGVHDIFASTGID